MKALELARRLEELFEDKRLVAIVGGIDGARSHSTRMARAMAASLVDELNAIVRPITRRVEVAMVWRDFEAKKYAHHEE